MDEKELKLIDRFERTPEGWLYFRVNPFTVYVWEHVEWGEVEPDGYEAVIHFGNSSRAFHDNIFPTEEEACTFAFSRIITMAQDLLKILEPEK